ncbi:hypothetical protein BU23DRAFT_483897, partial [Bimuria novae-zelandiae CBS 107.79]
FNTTWLETILNSGYSDNRIRVDELPNTKTPNFAEQVAETNLSFVNDRQPLVGFSTMIDRIPLEDFLDWRVLAHSYADSYRLLFARAMADVLDANFTTAAQVVGTRMLATDAVVLEPTFTLIVIGLLSVIVVATALLLCLSLRRKLNLRSDPSTIGTTSTLRTVSTKTIDKPVRPKEFRLWVSILIISLFIFWLPYSVDLNYSSLPPQLVFFKALRARHFLVAAVCSMALLTNVLSIAFAGLFNHELVAILKTVLIQHPFELSFVSINGSVGPNTLISSSTSTESSGAYLGGDGRDISAECSSNPIVQIADGPSIDDNTLERVCQNGTSSLELVLTLEAKGINVTHKEKEVCWGTVILGWARTLEGPCQSSRLSRFDAENSLFLHYGPSDLFAQSNQYIFQSNSAPWHNDTFATDFFNYFVKEAMNDSSLLNPKRSVPSWEEIQDPLRRAYASLFAIWLGGNHERLLIPRADASTVSSDGWRVVLEDRIFLSTPLFGLAQGILCMYAVVAATLYFRKPGKYLARLSTNLASVIALFAGSSAVQGMGGISALHRKARADSFEKLHYRYGYGSYVGTDGRVHIGIEKAPFVQPWKRVSSAGK